MLLAQRLYEAGYISYMRTDSINLSQDSLKIVRSYICDVYGSEYLSEKVNKYSSVFSEQQTHEAICLSNILLSLLMDNINFDLKNLYHLIWC